MIKSTEKRSVVREIEVYEALGATVGFPTLLWFGEWADMYCIVIDYRGCKLERLRSNLPEYFDAQTVAMFAIQMVRLNTHTSLLCIVNPLLSRLVSLSICILSGSSMATSNRTISLWVPKHPAALEFVE